MSGHCKECGAPVPESGSCLDNFHALLALEWQVPGGAGEVAHFYAVSSYVLQHPDSMSYTVESLAWLRSAVEDVLLGAVTIESLRHRARDHGASAGVTRRAGDSVHDWGDLSWTTNIASVLAAGVDGYRDRVRHWAGDVIGDLSATAG